MKEGYDEAMGMDLGELLDNMSEMRKLDPKFLSYQGALKEKLSMVSNDELEEIYRAIKKTGFVLREHSAQNAVEDVLVDRNLYIREEDGSLTRNSLAGFKLFKK